MFHFLCSTVIVPSLYLCWVDVVALRAGVWSISPEATLGIFLYDVLPLEEATFFFIVTLTLVLGYASFEKSFAVLDIQPSLFPEDKNSNVFLRLVQAFLFLEADVPQEPIKDLQLTMAVLRKASKSFWFAGFMFSPRKARIPNFNSFYSI
jgi:15-cis-phytoene synthase/lycopene beta-cyclase